MEPYWNYWVWNAFHDKLYSEAITMKDIIDSDIEFYEGVFKIENNQLIETELPEDYREVYKVSHSGYKYLLPVEFAKQMPLIPLSSFKCQLKKSDKKVWNYVNRVRSLSISGEKYRTNFREFIDTFNPIKHSKPKHFTLLKMIAFASIYKGIKLCISSNPNAGKNSNFIIINKILNNIGRFGTPTLAVFEKSLFFNQTTIIDEITSISPSQLRELEPIILTISDNSPDYSKHSLTSTGSLLNIDLSNKSLIFPYNRRKDVEKTGGVFFDEVWNNLPAFRSRFPQLLVDGEVLTSFRTYNKNEAKEVMEQYFDEMRKVAKELVFWKENLHRYKHNYIMNYNFTNRHSINLEGLFDVIDVYSVNQDEFDDWIGLIKDCMKEYRLKNTNRDGADLTRFEVEEEQIEVD